MNQPLFTWLDVGFVLFGALLMIGVGATIAWLVPGFERDRGARPAVDAETAGRPAAHPMPAAKRARAL